MLIVFFPSLPTCSMITEAMVHWLGCLVLFFSMIPFTSPYYVDSWHSHHDHCWFYFFAPLSASSMITAAMVSWLLRFFLSLSTYSISCILEPFCFFHHSWSSGQLVMLMTEAVIVTNVGFIFPISVYLPNDNWGDGQLWPIMLILFFSPLSTSSMATEAMVSW